MFCFTNDVRLSGPVTIMSSGFGSASLLTLGTGGDVADLRKVVVETSRSCVVQATILLWSGFGSALAPGTGCDGAEHRTVVHSRSQVESSRSCA